MSKTQEDSPSWKQVAELFLAMRESVPATDWTLRIHGAPDPFLCQEERDEIRAILFSSFRDVEEEWIQACKEWFLRRSIPKLSEAAKFWIRQAATACLDFCRSQVVPEPTPIQVPVPTVTANQLVYWMTMEWWFNVGIYKVLDKHTTDAAIFHAVSVEGII